MIVGQKKNLKNKNPKNLGQAMVEFALVLPVLLAMLWGIMELARLIQSYLVVTNAARFGVRYAVTGDYDTTICTTTDFGDDGQPGVDLDGGADDPCAGDGEREEIDTARVVGTYEIAKSVMSSLRLQSPSSTNPHTAGTLGDPNYFNITVCSNEGDRIYYWDPDSSTYADRCSTKSDTSVDSDHAGNPETGRHRVLVAVTYEHEFLFPVPFFPELATVTLHSERTSVLEQFRPAQVVQLPSGSSGGVPPTVTPTLTHTLTPTITDTPTVTNTPVPIHVEITYPLIDGQLINDIADTRFEAEAWDPNECAANTTTACYDAYQGSGGPGISNVRFWIYSEDAGVTLFGGTSGSPGSRTEGQVGYCAFGGNSPCEEWDGTAFSLDWGSAPNGTYTIDVEATATSGAKATDSITFVINRPPTPTPTLTPTSTQTLTPTITLTPTSTPAPSCSDLSIRRSLWQTSDDVRLRIRNNYYLPATLIDTHFEWPGRPTMGTSVFVNFFRLASTDYWPGNSSSSVIDVSDTGNLPGNGAINVWRADFNNATNYGGTHSVDLTFEFPGGSHLPYQLYTHMSPRRIHLRLHQPLRRLPFLQARPLSRAHQLSHAPPQLLVRQPLRVRPPARSCPLAPICISPTVSTTLEMMSA